MYSPCFRLKSFETLSDGHKFGVMTHLLEALVMANVAYLLTLPSTPNLYESGVRYLAEPDGRDEWQDIPDTIARGTGDCEDLACWRIAELRVRFREHALPRITVDELPDRAGRLVTTYHITVQRAGGQSEDPSRRLGMR